MSNEIFEFFKSLIGEKASLIILGLLAIFAIVAVDGNVIYNIIKEQQANAINNSDADGNSLANIITGKIANAINNSHAATTSLANIINEKNLANTINQSSNVNCNANKCITTMCIDNKCHTTATKAGSTNSASINIATINIGDPFYKQYDKSTSQRAVVVNGINASEISFSGTGVANEVSFTDTGKALIIPRTGGVILIQGNVVIKTNSTGEKATYTFYEIGHLSVDGMIRASGTAFFGSGATGKLAFLSNLVAIYKDQIDKAGNSNLTAWKWE
jgi:hypothetical protein